MVFLIRLPSPLCLQMRVWRGRSLGSVRRAPVDTASMFLPAASFPPTSGLKSDASFRVMKAAECLRFSL